MLRVSNLTGFNAGTAVAQAAFTQAITFEASATDTADLITYTFNGVDFGTPAASRVIVVAAHSGSGGAVTSLTSATINGSAATIAVQNTNSFVSAAIFSLPVAAGATGDIVMTWNGACNRCTYAVFTMTGLNSTTVFDTDSSVADSTTTRTASLTVPNGGLVVAAGSNNSGTDTFSWTNVTEQYDTQVESSLDSYSGAMAGPLASANPYTITMTNTQTNDITLVAAVWA